MCGVACDPGCPSAQKSPQVWVLFITEQDVPLLRLYSGSTKTKPFVATQGRQTKIKTTTNLLSCDWMGLEAGQQCALLALLSLIGTSYPAAGLFSLLQHPTIRNSLNFNQ